MDIFQQWLLIKIEEEFGAGKNPLEQAIPFESVVAMLKPLFEREDAVLDEEEVRRQLGALVEFGFLRESGGNYSLTLRGMVYAQAVPSVAQAAQDEFRRLVRAHWWKAAGVLILLAFAAAIAVNLLIR